MKITYNKTGGFGNIPVSLKVDTDTISDAATQSALLAQAQKVLTSKPNPATTTEGAADLATYQFSFQTDATNTNLVFDDLTMNDEVAYLTEMLMTAAGL